MSKPESLAIDIEKLGKIDIRVNDLMKEVYN